MLYLLPMKVLVIVIVLLLGTVLSQAQAENAPSIMVQARKDAEQMTLPVNKYTDAGLKAAQETSDHFHSSEFQEKIKCEEQRLERKVFSDYTAPWKKKQQTKEEQAKQDGSLTSTEKVYLFFSSSVPDETVQAYITTIVKAGDPNLIPVMRGWVKSMADTRADVAYFSRVLQKDLACRKSREPCQHYQVEINLQPSLFTKYGITRVPAVVYENGSDAYLIQGDAGLDYLLERINREAKSTALASLIKKMRGTY
ncbi:MAG: TrbC family F-type conjugative pilus assembly protein [Desulforhopalus sp.]